MILCCGEALIDMIPVSTDDGITAYRPHAGGAIFNTAIGLGRLGAKTGFLSGLSTDLFGQQLSSALKESGVDTGQSIYSDKPTTLAFVALNQGSATYTFYDENTAGRMLTPDMAPDLSPEVEALYFGGISLISEPCAEFYATVAAAMADSHAIMLDPNIRTGFIRDEAAYRERLSRLVSLADVVKVSDEDLDWIVPGSGDLHGKARALGAPNLVIVTRGGEGATGFLSDGTAVDVPAARAEMVDTVGAGDTFNAGVLAWLDRSNLLTKPALRAISPENLAGALEYGARVAAITVSRAGANPPWAHELEP